LQSWWEPRRTNWGLDAAQGEAVMQRSGGLQFQQTTCMRQSWRSTSTSGVSVSLRRLHSSSCRDELVNGTGQSTAQQGEKEDRTNSSVQCRTQLSRWHVGRGEEKKKREIFRRNNGS
jgi:hypothetical protein